MYKYLIVIISVVVVSCNSKKAVEVHPQKGNVLQAVYSSATIKPYEYYTVYSTVSGLIQKKFVSEGDTVSQGQLLFSVESKATNLNVENSKLAYQLATDRFRGSNAVLKELEGEMNTSKLKYANDSLNYFRQKNLFEKGVGTKNELELKKLQYTTALNTLEILQNKYNRTIEELKNDAQSKQNLLKTNKSLNSDLLMTSIIDGKVYDVLKEEGEFISMQEPFAIIGSANLFKVELLVDEVDVANISLGQKVIVSLNAYPKAVFEAKVMKIYPMMDARTQSFKVDCDFIEIPSKLYMGLSGEANVIVQEKKDVLLVPKEYIVNDTLISTSTGNVPFQRGIDGFSNVEVLSGVDATTVLALP